MKKTLFGILMVILGAAIASYPLISGINASFTQTVAVIDYERDLELLDEQRKEEELRKAREYNERLRSEYQVVNDPDAVSTINYLELLNINNKLGTIIIPKINVYLPIYHGVSSAVLDDGVGHMERTSLPVGGESTHSVLSGHTGLVRSKIFDDIDKLVIGDKFYLTVYGDTLAYQVDQIKTVLPNDDTYIQIENGKDLVTLLTCTPYGINTHRLLVRGTRVENDLTNEELREELQIGEPYISNRAAKYKRMLVIVIILVIFAVIIILYYSLRKEKPKRKRKRDLREYLRKPSRRKK